MDKINKLTLPATILIASIILGGFIFGTQIIKQQSIERQQEIKRRQDCYDKIRTYDDEKDICLSGIDRIKKLRENYEQL